YCVQETPGDEDAAAPDGAGPAACPSAAGGTGVPAACAPAAGGSGIQLRERHRGGTEAGSGSLSAAGAGSPVAAGDRLQPVARHPLQAGTVALAPGRPAVRGAVLPP